MWPSHRPTSSATSTTAECFASEAGGHPNAVQVLGCYGYTRDYPVGRIMRGRAEINRIYEGADHVQPIVGSRHLQDGIHSEL